MNPNLVAIVDTALELLLWAIFVDVILSWLPPPKQRGLHHSARRLFADLTEPVLAPIRRILPVTTGSVDFAPFVAVLIIEVARKLIRVIL